MTHPCPLCERLHESDGVRCFSERPWRQVLYLSHQNDNLRTEVPSLLHDINPLSFAQEGQHARYRTMRHVSHAQAAVWLQLLEMSLRPSTCGWEILVRCLLCTRCVPLAAIICMLINLSERSLREYVRGGSGPETVRCVPISQL